ncbi:hypothetical protein Ae168Ps1_6188c [Pseudonocardia sp. Ae168_Ps1]|nr:hypothetical protein Ae168Ps1_6188c [Pseudonocardia sp. Ae168_Ps1]OLL71560.1 hypothetical protein Ae263Ps1_6048c [Pseudonocardia sp. Ae263_Ps1]
MGAPTTAQRTEMGSGGTRGTRQVVGTLELDASSSSPRPDGGLAPDSLDGSGPTVAHTAAAPRESLPGWATGCRPGVMRGPDRRAGR